MPVEKTQIVTLDSGAVGSVKGVALTTGETGLVISTITKTRIICDNPSCLKGTHQGLTPDNKPTTFKGVRVIEWSDENEYRPAECYEIVQFVEWNAKTHVFCSSNCLTEWVRTVYTPLQPSAKIIPFPTTKRMKRRFGFKKEEQ